MTSKPIYLKPNVVFEPLIDRWYAWSHLVSPATAAMNITCRHLKIMESFLLSPETHAGAVMNPKMRGGPFMDLPTGRVAEIAQLKQQTLQHQNEMIGFAKAVKELDDMLAAEAKGFQLEELYAKIPPVLQGYVELFYDRNNHPNFRFFESLLYNSPYYKKSAQSMAFWITNNDHRPFVLSTPRLDEPGILHLEMAFDNMAIDELAKMKRVPQPIEYIRRLMTIPGSQEELFNSFFTEDQPPVYKKYTGDKIRMRYFGHACILVETKDLSILVDPLISYYGYDSGIQHFSDIDLPDVIDYVLITHNHQDHILFETLLPLRHKIRNIIVPRTNSGRLEDPDVKMMFDNIGFRNVTAIGEMEVLSYFNATIMGIPFTGEHSDLNILTKSCYLVRIGEFNLLFLADSRILEPILYQHIHRQVGDVDVIFIGMECDGAPLSWLYGPLITKKMSREQDRSRRLSGSDCTKGLSIVEIFKPREVYVYAMGQEPWVEFISSIKYTDESNPIVESNQLVKICESRDITAQRLYGEKEILYETKKTARLLTSPGNY